MFRVSLLAAVAILSSPAAALAQSPDEATIEAGCDSGGFYAVRGGPVQGGISSLFGGRYLIDLFVVPSTVHAAVGSLRENDAARGWLHLNIDAPSLDLADPELRLDLLSIQSAPVTASEHEDSGVWRVRLTADDWRDWYGPGGVDGPVYTRTGYTVDQPFGAEPYILFTDDHVGAEVYRRLFSAGGFTAEFHVPRRGLRSGYLYSQLEFSLAPLGPFMEAARAHFAQCDAAAGD
ncbi:hypothetical protein [Brevundimonas sp.]|uniref:hypothetical protein n=1 Tax=Brevundimonas sp. TaxID=1871086 RepID=UPI0025FCB1D4|nr:hypothetical protein [Brevundimonas sp.]